MFKHSGCGCQAEILVNRGSLSRLCVQFFDLHSKGSLFMKQRSVLTLNLGAILKVPLPVCVLFIYVVYVKYLLPCFFSLIYRVVLVRKIYGCIKRHQRKTNCGSFFQFYTETERQHTALGRYGSIQFDTAAWALYAQGHEILEILKSQVPNFYMIEVAQTRYPVLC